MHFDILDHEREAKKDFQILRAVKNKNKKKRASKWKRKVGDFTAGAVVQCANITYFLGAKHAEHPFTLMFGGKAGRGAGLNFIHFFFFFS